MSKEVPDLNIDRNSTIGPVTSSGKGRVAASQHFALTQNIQQSKNPNFNKAQHSANALSNSLVTLDCFNPNDMPKSTHQQQSQPSTIQSHQKTSNQKQVSSPIKARLKRTPIKSPGKFSTDRSQNDPFEQTQQQIQVQMEMQIRKQQLKLQMQEKTHFTQIQTLPHHTTTQRPTINAQQEPHLVPVAIVFEATNSTSENKTIQKESKTPAASFQNRITRDTLQDNDSHNNKRVTHANQPGQQSLQHPSNSHPGSFINHSQSIPFGDTSNSLWQNYSELQQQQHVGVRSSVNNQINQYHQKNLSQVNQKETNGHIGVGSEMLDQKTQSYAKSKERQGRLPKGGQQAANINLSVTNSRHTNSNAPIKQKTKPSQKLKRAGTAVAEGSQSISRAQKVANYQNRSLGKNQSIPAQTTGKKQTKENSNNQSICMEQSTYQTIKNMVQGKNHQLPPQAMKAQHQPQLQLQRQQSSGQKQRPKSSNPISSTMVKRRTILHMRDDSHQLNLQNQQPGSHKHQMQRTQLPGTNITSTQNSSGMIDPTEIVEPASFTEPSSAIGMLSTQSRSKTNLISQNVPLCITGSLMQQQQSNLNQPQIMTSQNFHNHTNYQNQLKDDIQKPNQTFFIKRNNRDSFQRENTIKDYEKQELNKLAVIDFNPSQKQQNLSKPAFLHQQMETNLPPQSYTAKPKMQGTKIEMALVSSEYNARKTTQQPPKFESLPMYQRPQSSTNHPSYHKQTVSMTVNQTSGATHGNSFMMSDAESEHNQSVTNVNQSHNRKLLARNDSTVVCEGVSRSEKYSNSLTQQSMAKSVHSSEKESEAQPSKPLQQKYSIPSTASPASKIASNKPRKSGTQPIQQAISTHHMQMLPSTPKIFKRTKRVHFARRMSYMDRPLIVINFQGVIGDFIKMPAFKYNPNAGKFKPQHRLIDLTKEEKAAEQELNSIWRGLNLRQGALEGLKYLSQQYQLVVFSRETIEESWFEQKGGQVSASGEQTKVIMNLLLANPEIKLDGLYTSTLPHKNQNMCDDYSQIFVDFGMNSEKKVCEKVLFLNSIANDFASNNPTNGRKATKDIDNKGFFMFDMSCQPAIPLVRGLPISLEVKSDAMSIKSRTLSDFGGVLENDKTPIRREMPVTLLVPNVRNQTLKTCLNFSQIVKSVMLMAYLGQKKNTCQLLKDVNKDPQASSQQLFYNSAITVKPLFGDVDEGTTIKEKFISLKNKSMRIVQQPSKCSPEKETKFEQTISLEKKHEKKSDRLRKEKTQRMLTRNIGGQSPSGSVNSHLSGGQTSSLSTQSNLHNRTHHGYGRSASTNSEKFRSGLGSNSEMLENTLQFDGHLNHGREASPGLGSFFQTESHVNLNATVDQQPLRLAPKEMNIELTDQFYQNLSWTQGADFLSEKDRNAQRNYLGFRTAYSDLVWRFYSKQIRENLQIKALYEQRMEKIENLVKKTLSNDTIVANREKNIDAVFQILRCGNLNGNPMGMTMGRNYRFFTNIYVQMRSKLSKELRQWKELNENAQNLGGEIASQQQPQNETPQQEKEGENQTKTIEDRRALRHQQPQRIGSILNNTVSGGKGTQRTLATQDVNKVEDLLERNNLYNRIVTVGLDQPQLYFSFVGQKGKVLEKFNPQAPGNHQNYSSNIQSNNNNQVEKAIDKPIEKGERASSRKSHQNVGSVPSMPATQVQASTVNIDRPFEQAQHKKKHSQRQQHHLSKQQRTVVQSIECLIAPGNQVTSHSTVAPNSGQPLSKLNSNPNQTQPKHKKYMMQCSLPMPDPSPMTAMTTAANTVQSHQTQAAPQGGDCRNSVNLGGFSSGCVFAK